MKVQKLIKDIISYINSCEHPCDMCDVPEAYRLDECENCGNKGLSLKDSLLTYQLCEESDTFSSWIEFAFSDIGADLKPIDYGIVDYYDDEMTDDEKEKTEIAVNATFATSLKEISFEADRVFGGHKRVTDKHIVTILKINYDEYLLRHTRNGEHFPLLSFETYSGAWKHQRNLQQKIQSQF